MEDCTCVLVYRFGLLPPTQNGELARSQMRAGHVYRNRLTEIERKRRDAHRAVLAAHGNIPAAFLAAEAATAAEVTASLAIRAARAESRCKSETDTLQRDHRAAKTARREAVRTLREMRAVSRTDPVVAAAIDRVNLAAAEERREARGTCGVYWGTYLLAEDAAQAAMKAPMYDGAEKNDPRFLRWTGEGSIGVQLQNGLVAKDAFAADTRLQIDPVNDGAWHHEVRGIRKRLSRTKLRVRISSDGRAPVWGEWPMIMHREIPEGAVIKRVTVSLTKRGPREEWAAQMTMEIPTVARRARPSGEGAVAIDLGWRVVDEVDLRVASWASTDGVRGEIRLGAGDLASLTKADSLRAIRDRAFDAARATLAAWIAAPPVEMPAWLPEATAHLGQWKSPARLAGLTLRWKTERFAGDGSAYDPLEAWRYQDNHLWRWESSQRIKSLRRRREVYRVAAATLARQYKTVVLEKFDLRRVAEQAPIEDTSPDNKTARGNRQLAAVSELKNALVNAFAEVAYVDAMFSTKTCSACGSVETFDAAEHLRHSCGACGVRWDQDENAALNLLERWRERPSVAPAAVSARGANNPLDVVEIQESRWQRARRMAAAKAIARGGARKEALADAES